MNRSTIKKKVYALLTYCTADAVKHFDERFMGERVISLVLGKYTVAATNRLTDCLARLILGPVFNEQVIIRYRPSFFLKVSRLENALIQENKVTTALNDIVKFLIECICFVLELLHSLFFLSWNVTDFYLLQS